MLRAIKKPRTFFRRGFGCENAIVNYARGSPEARQGFAVFAVRLVFMTMERAYAGDFA